MSNTVTEKEQTLLLPLLSRAVAVTVVTPTGNAEPLAGVLTRFVTAQLSLADTLKVTLVEQRPDSVSTTRLAGQATTGG